jgi:hypothetical protein
LDGLERGGWHHPREKEERIHSLKNLERKRMENEGKLALVALNSPCGLIASGLALIHNLILN